MTGSTPARRTFLFLQGLPGSFFRNLGAALAARGHRVLRVNFCAGDRLFWRDAGSIDFRAPSREWPATIAGLLARRAVTDIVMFGDCRPLHRSAIQAAKALGVAVHIVEEGYLRPDWVTVEAGGVNAYSSLPRDPDWFRAEAALLADLPEDQAVPPSMARRFTDVLAYNLVNTALWWLYPRYRTHRPWHPAVEALGWTRRLLRRFRARLRPSAGIGHHRPQYLFPLQLDCDTQIRVHSGFGRMHGAIELVLASFAAHAPRDALLIVKEHPFDNGLTDWRKLVADLAARLGVAHRVIYLAEGDINRLVAAAAGVVTINSTTGALALSRGVPVIALAPAIYDLPGMTHRNGLNTFWHAPQRPDPALFDAFRRVLIDRCLVRGDLFSREGQRLLIEGAVARLERRASPVAHPARVALLRPSVSPGFEFCHAPVLHS
jgi:capsular polysaccharide export protein